MKGLRSTQKMTLVYGCKYVRRESGFMNFKNISLTLGINYVASQRHTHSPQRFTVTHRFTVTAIPLVHNNVDLRIRGEMDASLIQQKQNYIFDNNNNTYQRYLVNLHIKRASIMNVKISSFIKSHTSHGTTRSELTGVV